MSDLDKMKHEPPRTTEQVFAGTTPPPPPGKPNPEVVEEAGSRALADALRSSFVIVKILMIGLVVLFFFSGIFTVPSQERAIVLRFGKPVGIGQEQLLGPGLHWSYPSPIDEVVRIPIAEVQTITSRAGWFQTTPEQEAAGGLTGTEQPNPGAPLNPAADGYTITADGNIIHVRATVRYRIAEPLKFALDFVNATNVLQNAVDNALFFVSSTFTVEQATRSNKEDFRAAVEKRIRDLAQQYELGVSIVECQTPIIPPLQVKQAFDDVTNAEIERRKARDEAEAYATRVLSTAQGEAAAIVNQGKTEANQLVQQVAAESRYFKEQLPYYEKQPGMFKARLHAEAMARILTNVQEKVFALPEGSQTRLLLNPPPRRRQTPNADQQRR